MLAEEEVILPLAFQQPLMFEQQKKARHSFNV
jgi:hypothetical protein